MRRIVATLALVFTIAIPSAPVSAQGTRPLVIGRSGVLHSDVLDENRPIIVSLPVGYEQSGRPYPVLYLLDGPANIHHTTGTINYLARVGEMPPMIVIGIGNTDRTRDLTPVTDGDAERFPTAGGADRFLKFVETELIPFVEKEFRTAPYRVFVGHSFGGLCAVHAFVNRPDLFDAYVSISPSLWWNDGRLLRDTETLLAARRSFPKSLFVTMGNEPGPMFETYQRFIDIVEREAPDDFDFGHLHLPDETHGSTPLRSTIHALKMIYADWGLPNELFVNADIEGIEAHAAKLSEKFGYEIKPPEMLVNNLGYQVLATGNTNKAIRIFRYNLELYPDSANVHDSLGEAMEAAGKLEQARELYEKAVQRGRAIDDPGTPVFRQHLEAVKKRISNIS